MKRIEFYDIEDFCTDVLVMYEDFCGNPDYDISIVAKYDEAREVVRYLSQEFPLFDIQLQSPTINGYLDEYLVSINEDGLWCEPAKNKNGYIDEDTTVTYVFDNCSSAVLKNLHSPFKFEVHIIDDCEYDDCESCTIPCCECDMADCCDDYEDDYEEDECEYCDVCGCADSTLEIDDDMHGFSFNQSDENGSYSCSFYSTNEDWVNEMLKIFR